MRNKEMIGKKTLSAILGYKVEKVHNLGGFVGFKYLNGGYDSISPSHLVSKAEDWALGLGWVMSSGVVDTITKLRFATATNGCFSTSKTFNMRTKEEAIYRLCKYIRNSNK